MLGSEIALYLSEKKKYKIFVTARELKLIKNYNFLENCKILTNVDVLNNSKIEEIIKKIKPNIIINCVGVIKQKFKQDNIKNIFLINSLFPKHLSYLSEVYKYRFIHFSTDCVFSGKSGNYTEESFCDANDYYGISKFLGETVNKKNVVIRTSIIGHELNSNNSLLNWFLTQKKSIKGYSNAIFSGFTTPELARILYNYIIKNEKLSGLFHLSSKPINKYNLLLIIKKIYKKKIKIVKDKKIVVDRSLNSQKFIRMTKFKPRSWEDMIYDLFNYKNLKN